MKRTVSTLSWQAFLLSAVLLATSEFSRAAIDQPQLELLSVRCFRGAQPDPQRGDPDDFSCVGKVKNVSNRVLNSIKVKVRYVLPGGRQVDDGVTLDPLPLPPGKVSAFDLIYYSAPKGNIGTTFWFATYDEQPVPHRDARKTKR